MQTFLFHSFFICIWITHTLSVGPNASLWRSSGGTSERSNVLSAISSTPYFDTTSPTNVTAQIGTHAFLPCKVIHLGNKSVSWIRKRDSHILTVDRYTFIADERFQVLHNLDTWTLQIKYVQARDEGPYECQVTSEPKISNFVSLEVVVPQTKILGEADIFVKTGSNVQLRCIITQSLEQPPYIFWYHHNIRLIETPIKHMWVDKVNSDTTIGTLVIKSTEKSDSGNYTCAPSNLDSDSIMLHVLNGEHPAAMQQGSRAHSVHYINIGHYSSLLNSALLTSTLLYLTKCIYS